MTSKKRFIGLDYLKIIAILMVIALHVPVFSINFIQTGKPFNLIQYALRLLTEGVPLFLIVNGFLLFRKNIIDYKALAKKTCYYFFLYLLFGSLTILIMNTDQSLSFNNFMISLLIISSGQPYVGSLWFIQSLVATYLMFPVFHYIYKSNYSMFKMIFGAVVFLTAGKQAIQVVAEILVRSAADCYGYLTYIVSAFDRFDPFNISSFLLFFLLGAVVNQHIDVLSANLKKLWTASILSWLISIIYSFTLSNITLELLQPAFFYGSFIMILQTVTVFITFLKIEEKGTLIEKAVSFISSSTLWIYFVHNILIYLFRLHSEYSSFAERVVLLLQIFAVSLIIAAVIQFIEKVIINFLQSQKQSDKQKKKFHKN